MLFRRQRGQQLSEHRAKTILGIAGGQVGYRYQCGPADAPARGPSPSAHRLRRRLPRVTFSRQRATCCSGWASTLRSRPAAPPPLSRMGLRARTGRICPLQTGRRIFEPRGPASPPTEFSRARISRHQRQCRPGSGTTPCQAACSSSSCRPAHAVVREGAGDRGHRARRAGTGRWAQGAPTVRDSGADPTPARAPSGIARPESFASNLITRSDSRAGTAGLRSTGGVACRARWAWISSRGSDALNGNAPVRVWYRTTPRAYRSLRVSTPRLIRPVCSGGM